MSRPKRILVVDPSPELPGPDALLAHLRARGVEATVRRPTKGEAPPATTEGLDGLVVMGGVEMVTDRPAWMAPVQALQREMAARGAPQLGICLGGQLLADTLGGAVDWHPEGRIDFGFHRLAATNAPDNPVPDGLMALSGNSQGFTLPREAERLALGATFPEQAFRVGHALGLQFHPEVTRPILDFWQTLSAANHGRPNGQPKDVMDAGFAAHDAALKAWLHGLLDRWFDLRS